MNTTLEKLIIELQELDHQLILVEGRLIKPSQCFRYETNPLHLMFNTNCPKELKANILAIFKKHFPSQKNDDHVQ